MQDNLAYRYFAFISYSSKDKKVAEKIQRKIETYRLPTVLRNELEASTGKKYPQRIKPLFRDMTDLSAGLLGKSILRELEDSRYLLVICSPESAKSEWVNREVENFILMGRYERIIPYIIEGEPNSGDPETECFPPILRKFREYISYSDWSDEKNAEQQAKLHALLDGIDDELKGISLSGEGPRISRLKIIARMLEVAPDTIIQRDRQRQKKRIFWSSFAAMFFVILFTCLGLWTWDRYYRVHVGYFADYVEYWGVPRGIFPLSPDQWKHRQEFYKIYTQDQKVIRLEHVNSAETPIPVENSEFKDRPTIAVYRLYENDRLVQRDTLDRNGKVVISYLYSGDKMQKVDFKTSSLENKTLSPAVLTNMTSLSNPIHNASEGIRGEIGNMRIQRDKEGRVEEVYFQKGGYDTPITDEQGIAGFRYKLDELGRVIEKIYLDQDGAPRPNKNGVASQKNRYDDKGNLVETQYFDANGNLTFNENDWMRKVITLDNLGNIAKEEFFDSSENSLFLSNVYKYNDQGNRIEEAYYGDDGELSLCSDGYAKVKWKYDEQGDITETAYFGDDDKPCLYKNGYAKISWQFDERGNITEVRYFNIDDKPCLSKDGYAKFTNKYDAQGNKIEVACFDVNDKPCLLQDGYAKFTNKYDAQGNVIETAYFDTEDKPCLNKDGYAKITWKYDERGNVIETAYFGVDGQSCLSKNSVARFTKKYDEHGNKTEEAYFGIDGKLCLCNDGFAKITDIYDDRGNLTEFAFRGADDKPCLCDDGYAKFTAKYDKRGNLTEAEYFGADDKPCLNKDGYAKFTKKYDEQGNIIEQAYFGVDNQPCSHKYGNAKITWEYDGRGNKTEEAYFDVDNKPCLGSDHYAKVVWQYDERGNQIEEAHFDVDGQPCLCQHNNAKLMMKYDERGNKIETAAFGIDGKHCLQEGGFSIIAYKYNERGKKTEEACFGVDGKPCMVKDGYAKCVYKYDERGNEVEEAFWDVDDKPCLYKDGYAKVTWKHDERDYVIEAAYFGIDDKPCLCNDGYAKISLKYDDRRNLSEVAYFGIDDKPCLNKEGIAKFISKHDERGNSIDVAYFGTDDKPCLHEEGYARFTREFDEQGYVIEQAYFGVDNQPCSYKDGYAKIAWKYDERGNKTEEAYFDTDGKPCLGSDDYAKAAWKYDKRGNQIEEAHFDIDGQLCLCKHKIAIFTQKYDERGNKIEEAYFGIDGKPCLDDEEIAGFKSQFNEKNQVIRREFFGLDGKPCVLGEDDPFTGWEKTYHENGKVAKQTWFYTITPYKNVLGKQIDEFDERGNNTSTCFLDMDDQPCLYDEGYAKSTSKYDDQGHVIEAAYFDVDDKPCMHKDGYAKFTRKYDERGNEIEEAYFGIDGKPCLDNEEVASVKSQFDENNQEIRREFFGLDGKPCVLGGDDPFTGWEKSYHENGKVAKQTWFYTITPYKNVLGKQIDEFDERGNNTSTCFLDMDDQPCLCDEGYAKAASKYDERGNQIEQAFFGIDNKPCLCEDEYAKVVWQHDEQGHVIEAAYFDINNKPCLNDEEIAGSKSQYNEKNQEIRREFFGIDGKPCVIGGDDPYTGWEKSYYDNGERSKLTWLYTIKPYKNVLGKWVYEYDENGNNILTYCLDMDDQPCLCDEGYAKITAKYDERGNEIEKAYFDINNKPCLNDEEIAGVKSQFNEKNQVVRREFFGIDGKPCVIGGDDPYTGWEKSYYDNGERSKLTWLYTIKPYKNVLGKWISEYDERGNNTSVYFMDMNNKPCLNNEQIAGVKSQYDNNNQEIRREYFGIDGKPCALGGDDPFTGWEKTYHENGKVSKLTTYYTIKPYKNVLGKWISELDEQGNIFLTYCLNINDKPCLCDDGFASVKSQFDENNQEIRREFFGLDGKPCVLGGDDPFTGWEKSFYEDGTKSKQAWLYTIKPYKNVLGKWIHEYDEHGNNVLTYCLDMNDKPCLCDKGYAKSTSKYDDQGHVIEAAYFDVEDKPCMHKDGYAKFTRKFDERGNKTEEAYFGIDNKPCLTNEEIAGHKSQFDEKNQEIRQEFFGIDGKPCALGGDKPFTGWEKTYHENGYVSKRTLFYTIKPYKNVLGKWVSEYDERGNNVLTYCLDMNDKPCLCDDGFAGVKSQYDENNQEIRREFFGLDGKPCVLGGDDPYTGWEKTYHENGEVSKLTTYYTIKPFRDVLGKWVNEYDEHGNNTLTYFVDINDKPCLCDEGYSKITGKYDEQGNQIELAYFGIDDQPCLCSDGYAKITMEYDEQGNVTKKNYYDVHGKEVASYVSVQEVLPDSNSEKYGIKKGDFFILYDGQLVENYESFIEKRSKETGNDAHELVILRDKEFIVIQIHPGKLGCVLGTSPLSKDQQKRVLEKLKMVKSDSTPPQND